MGNKADLRKRWISENVRFGDMSDRDADEIDEVETVESIDAVAASEESLEMPAEVTLETVDNA